ncbi:peroxisomal acyl-coenzyme A oxidase 1-like [Diadema antillarum]|uniref:peroxisomal acyl-coenzyme A oxidase 1-like n=1 Tax=Diadema antillarum TaxID=105358 RepID=UPI003A8C7BA8
MSDSMTARENPRLTQERRGASFDKHELTLLLNGGPQELQRIKYIQSIVLSDPHFDQSYRFTLSPAETFDQSVKRAVRWVAVKEKYNLTQPRDDMIILRCMNNNIGFAIHTLMFIPSIERLGTEEQKAKWLPLARQYKILGTYAQTELGHGTYLSGLETTATYDEMTQEFVLNSPTQTAMKWWPGALGKTCTHCIILAQLIVRGKRHGVHAFILQLRSLETHQPLPGRTIGDIGLKSSYAAIDNGFLILEQVRIPRENMLMKYAKVSQDGVFSIVGNPKVTYGSMVLVRTAIVRAASYELSKSLTIAVRYSAVRTQGKIEDSGPEVPILDFQTQQQKLFPGLAAVFAIYFAGQHLRRLYEENEESLLKGDFSILPELHALCSGLKALATRESVLHMETCRFACGGHGVMLQSGLPELYDCFSASCIYEGENTVLLLQVAGYLMKILSRAQMGADVSGVGAYLANQPEDQWRPHDSLDGESIFAAYKHRAQRLGQKAGERLAGLMAQGMTQKRAWNESGIDLVKAARAHTQYFIVQSFYHGVEETQVSPATKKVLEALCRLYALYHVEENAGEFVVDGFISSDQLDWLHRLYLETFPVIRPEAVTLVDSFDICDEFLQSTLGCYDGNVYERMYEYAKTDPRNKTEVHETYYKYLRPLLKGLIAKL